MLTIENLSELAKKHTFTAAEKTEIKATADVVGIAYDIKRGCSNCYSDLVLEIYNHLSKMNDIFPECRKYVLKHEIDVIIGYPNGRRLNAATITDEWAEELIAKGFGKYFEDAN